MTLHPPPAPPGAQPHHAPCAGLFGWRKDAAAPRREAEETDEPGKDYPPDRRSRIAANARTASAGPPG